MKVLKEKFQLNYIEHVNKSNFFFREKYKILTHMTEHEVQR